MFKAILAVIYFLAFAFCIDLVFRHTLSAITDILAIVCWFIAAIASVALAIHTEKRIRGRQDR